VSVEIYNSLGKSAVFLEWVGPLYRLASRFRESVPVTMLRRVVLREFEIGTLVS
jgi:hypothetical protein